MTRRTIADSLFEQGYAEGYRIGIALASYEMVERILKKHKPFYYKENKHKILRMSESQAQEAFYHLIDVFSHDNDIDDSDIAAYFEEL